MKSKIALFFSLSLPFIVFSQVGINNTNPSATLDITASDIAAPNNTDGILVPRVDEFPLINPTSAQDGMMVFVTGAGVPAKGFYYWDNSASSWLAVGGSSDADFYEIGSATPPDDISDNQYTLGKIHIGATTLPTSSLSITNSDSGDRSGLRIGRTLSTPGSGGGRYGLEVPMTVSSSDNYIGISTSFLGSSIGTASMGMSATASATINADFTLYSGNFLSSSGTGDLYGNQSIMLGGVTNTGDKYGTDIYIDNTVPGTHYGVRSRVPNGTGYAGYFVGRMSLGEDFSIGRYVLPGTDGTAGQVMTTDGSGQISFSTPTSGAEKIDDLTDGKSDSDGSSVFLGINAGALDDSSANANVGIGFESLTSNTTGYHNNAIGWGSMRSNDTGNSNVAFGYLALSGNTSGRFNTALGMRTLISNTTSDNNTAVGNDAMYVSTGANNVAVGKSSLFSFNGSNNTAIGLSAGEITGGDGNVFIGYEAGSGTASADNRLFVENTDADSNNALIYGEFGTDATTAGNILRTNSEFQIGNPAGTGYAFPSADGISSYVLQTDGAGQVSFVDPAALGDGDTQNTLNEAYNEGGAGFGASINATAGAVTVAGEDGFVVTGTIGAGNTIDAEVTGAGARMFFNPRKGAFRAGRVTGNQWDDANIGDRSIAFGEDVTASFLWDVAMGYQSTASGGTSTAIGSNAVASGLGAVSLGSQNTASGDRALSLGTASSASSDYAITMGFSAEATNDYATAFGYNTSANGARSMVAGIETQSQSYGETVFGIYNTSYTPNSTTAFNLSDRLFVVGNGMSGGNRSNALTIYKNGELNINDAYNMPTTDGTAGQVMTTDGAGQVSFTTIDDGDSDWYEVGTTNPPNDIMDNKFTSGSLSIGKNTAAIGKVDIESTDKLKTLQLTNTTAITGVKNGIFNSLSTTNANGFSTGVTNVINGSANFKYGVRNFLGTNSASTINEVGVENVISSTGTVNLWGYNNYYQPTNANNGTFIGFANTIGSNQLGQVYGYNNAISSNSNSLIRGINNSIGGSGNAQIIGTNTIITNTGIGIKYGELISIDSALGGTHYGVRVEVQKATGFAAYFIGRTSLGTGFTNRYLMPSTDGTAGQVITTDGSGNTSWQNPSIPELSLARMTMSASQTDAGSGWNKVNFDTVDFDLNNDFNTTFDYFVAPTTGHYRIGGTWRDISETSTLQYAIAIYVNGTRERATVSTHGGSGVLQRSINSLFALNANDTVEIYYFRDSAIVIDNNTLGSFFEIEQVR